MNGFTQSMLLLFVLLNPFALSVYLVEMLHENRARVVSGILLRAGLIAVAVFALFAWAGEAVFTEVLQVRFAAFQVFGGIVFLIFAVRSILQGGGAMVSFRGEPGQIAGTIAMPFMIGPATVSAAILMGVRLPTPVAVLAIASAVALTMVVLLFLKVLLDHVRQRNAALVERYVDITGRITALVVGTIATEMVFRGLETWIRSGLAAAG